MSIFGHWLEHRKIAVFDDRADELLERCRGNKLVDRLFYGASEAANHSIIWHSTNALLLIRTRNFKRFLTIAAILGVESALVNGPIKSLFHRERPTHEGERPHQLRQPLTSSFPSGHATSAFCAAAVFTKVDPKGKLFYYCAAGIVSTSRAYVKIHHASDVIAGIAVGAALGAAGKRFVKR